MLQKWFVTIGAGIASTLLFVLSAKGSLGAMVVTYFTPMPIMIAALGWGPVAGFASAAIAAATLALTFDPMFGVIHALAFGLPAWWLGHIALLARFDTKTLTKAETAGGVQREWYPLGQLVAWAAGTAIITILVGLFSIGFIGSGFETAVHLAAVRAAPLIAGMIGDADRLPAGITVDEIAIVAVKALPVIATASLTLLLLVNLWLAGRTVEMSRRLSRPWPAIPENLRLPKAIAWTFPILVILAIALNSYGGLIARVLTAAIAMILALQGLAVIHALTRKRGARLGLLIALYAALVLLMPWPLLCCVLIGLVDAVFALRDRGPRIRSSQKPS